MQTQSNKCIFSACRNCPRERWCWRRLIGKVFHRRGPATPNARSPRHVRVRGTKHVMASDDHSWRRLAAAKSWQSSVKHCGACPCSALNTSTASLNWTELAGGLEASAAAREQAICGRAIECQWSEVRRRSGPLEAVASVHQQYHTWDCCSSPGVLTGTTGQPSSQRWRTVNVQLATTTIVRGFKRNAEMKTHFTVMATVAVCPVATENPSATSCTVN